MALLSCTMTGRLMSGTYVAASLNRRSRILFIRLKRGSYCAISIAALLNICTVELMENVAEFILECQTYEGGIAGVPGGEAHGGYTFWYL
jgi:hypothetical protein